MAYADPILELKHLRNELDTFTKSYAAGDDVPAEKAARIDTVLARAAELGEIIERGKKNAAVMTQIAGHGGGDTEYVGGFGALGGELKSGFLTPAGIKAMAQAGTAQGIKALVAGGSSTTPVALDKNPIRMGQPNLGLLSLIPIKERETPSYSYLRQTVRTNNAAVVAPGATKPTSVYTVATVPGSLAVVAHLSEQVDKYLLEDNSDLERFLTGELTNGIVRKVTSDAIAAFLATSGIQTLATSATYTTAKGIDGIYAGASAVGDLGYTPDLIVVSRATYDAFRVSKDAENRYLAGNPFESTGNPGLWGINTLVSSDVANNTAIVLDTSQVGISTDKQGIQTTWDAITGFDKNQVRARTEGRFGYDVFAPAAIAKITFTA